MSSLHASFRKFRFDYSLGALSVPFHHEASSEDVVTPSAGSMKGSYEVLKNGTKVLLLVRRYRLKEMLHV